MAQWDSWIGREDRRTDRLDIGLARRWTATFDFQEAAGAMPQGIHFCLGVPDAPTGSLGEDGHPARQTDGDTFLPPVPLPRRMWAGSQITFHRPLSCGANVVRTSRIAAVTEKEGGSGRLVFVDVDHEAAADDQLAVTERQTLVYRESPPADAALSPPEPTGAHFDYDVWDAHRVVVPDAPLLFRYSALTFNSHRIHYDVEYARGVERYRGLVVHGPLTASLLLQLAGAQFGDNRLARFNFRGLSPAIVGEPLHLVMRGAGDALEMAAFAADGRQVVAAEAALA